MPLRARTRGPASVAALVLLIAACTAVESASPSHGLPDTSFVAASPTSPGATPPTMLELARQKIQHVVVIMQENRSFDAYFGTYPGADGIPMNANGKPSVCVPDPAKKTCVRPYHDTNDIQVGGPHAVGSAIADIDGGRMDGFIAQAESGKKNCNDLLNPACSRAGIDSMGYHDRTELGNYWHYADDFVLQDQMFEPNASWSLPEHLFMVSEWSAVCDVDDDPTSCKNNVNFPNIMPNSGLANANEVANPNYAWTDMTYILHAQHVSWGYYVFSGTQPDCQNGEETCAPVDQNADTPGIWNPLPYFSTVKQDGQLGNIKSMTSFFTAAKNGRLPAVSWVVPSHDVSEHPPASVQAGQAYVTGVVNAIMQSPDWPTTAIFLAWDDWGGFYDHVPPPSVDENGYGLRVPGLLISPYAKHGFIDHQTLSFDAYSKLIEDLFLGGQRLDPATDGRPDPRPDVREDAAILGDLLKEFNFNQPARPPDILPTTWTLPPGA
ncbi:MAG TPA: alkaline phosphatase family protein [Candidatus Limnocylindrales bacterium]